eukprot:2083406-Karenia_brevis.AAC.1
MWPFQLARRVGSGSEWRYFSMRCTDGSLCLNVISFIAAMSSCEKGGQWQRVARLLITVGHASPVLRDAIAT